MAGLYELQLSTTRRSHDASESRPRSKSGVIGNSSSPDVNAREIASQFVTKRDTTAASSIFPWKRKPTGQGSSRSSFDTSSRNDIGVSNKVDSQLHGTHIDPSARRVTEPIFPQPHSLPPASTSIDFTLTPSSPDPMGSTANALRQPRPHHATSANSSLVHSGLGIGPPPRALHDPSSPTSALTQRKAISRPGTSQGKDNASSPTLSFKVQNLRRVRSFNKSEVDGSYGGPSTRPAGNAIGKAGAVGAFSLDPPSSIGSDMQFTPAQSSRAVDIKGKGKAIASDAESIPTILENPDASSWEEQTPTSPLSPTSESQEQVASRRISWWPGRRRMDSSPAGPRPPQTLPPPIPQRSQARSSSAGNSTPSLPSLRPFSPFMSEFQASEGPDAPASSSGNDSRDASKQGSRDHSISIPGEGLAPVRRRHSLNHRTGGTHSHATSISSQISDIQTPQNGSYSTRTRRLSWSQSIFPSSRAESNPSMQSTPFPSPSIGAPQNSKSQAADLKIKTTRRRSMTINSPPVSPPLPPSREVTPLLLRHPVIRHNPSARPPDPFLTGWSIASGTRANLVVHEGDTPTSSPMELRRTPSTSSGSASSLSNSVPAVRSPQQHSTALPARGPITASSTSVSLPPPSSSNRLLRRLSSAFFNSTSTPPTPMLESSQFASNSASYASGVAYSGGGTNSPAISNTSSPRRSRENLPDGSRTSMESIKQRSTKPPSRIPDETPEDYVQRLVETVSKAEVAHILAANGEPFYVDALRSYISRFKFQDDPLDVALRKLLMDVGLPRETQQIDRVMEAFAARYSACNPGIFENNDHPYILAFSLIMLHTDTFNKSNKKKMSKADYIKNAKLPGVPPEILECFFDNIVFAPFIFIEDPTDTTTSRQSSLEVVPRLSPISGPAGTGAGTLGNGTGSAILGKANKIDPYYLITQNLLGPLRADVNSLIPKSNPMLFEGTDWPWDTRHLHRLFALAQLIHVSSDAPPSSTVQNGSTTSAISTPMRRKSIALPSLGAGYGPFLGTTPFGFNVSSPNGVLLSSGDSGPKTIRIAKVDLLARKDDLVEGGKRSINRKWRDWSVLLTSSQLLFFRDINFASHVDELRGVEGTSNVSDMGLLNPDEAIPLRNCIALVDLTYQKYSYTFRFLMPTGKQYLFQALSEKSMNEWISAINYASTFKTAGVSMRGLGMSDKDVEMTGVAAAASHLQERSPSKSFVSGKTGVVESFTAQLFEASHSQPQPSTLSSGSGSGSKLLKSPIDPPSVIDFELPGMHRLEGAQQRKATFDEVKAELASHGNQRQPSSGSRVRTLSMGSQPTGKPPSRPATAAGSSPRSNELDNSLLSRSATMQARVESWDSKINRVQTELDAELRIARNLAILTPFQRATRDRIQLAVTHLAKKVRIMRTELTRLHCYRFVLLSDLVDEERHLEQAKRDALKAAIQRLSIEEGFARGTMQKRIADEPIPQHLLSPPSGSESFHSAMETLDESGNLSTSLSMLSEDDIEDEASLPRMRASPDAAALEQSPKTKTQLSNGPPADGDGGGHEKFYTAAEVLEEIAEVWSETRAANRVSLVKLPSDVRLFPKLNRQGYIFSDDDGRQQQDI